MDKFDIIVFITLIFVVIAIIIILKNNKKKEGFIVSDAQEINNYKALKQEVMKQPDNFNKEDLNSDTKKIEYDNKKEDDYQIMVVHGEPKSKAGKLEFEKSFITAKDFGYDNPFPLTSCANSSVDSRFKTGPKRLLPRDISCGFPNKLTAENYYKTHYQAEIAHLEDYAVRGANYMEFSDYVHPTKSNIRILSQNTKGLPPKEMMYKNIPTGYNYGFHNTPAMRLP